MKDNTIALIVGISAMALMAFLFWRASVLTSKTGITDFTRDEQGRIIEILERETKR